MISVRQLTVSIASDSLSAEGTVRVVRIVHTKSVLALCIPVSYWVNVHGLFTAAAAKRGVPALFLLMCGASSAVPS